MAVFGKKEKDLMDRNIATVISDGCVIDGNITSTSSVKIDGLVNGDVKIQQGIIIGNTGKVLGNVKAHEAIIFGSINGNISVDKLEIKATGRINGDISTQTIEMEFGSVYNGKVTMNASSTSVNASSNGTNVYKKEASKENLVEN
jgi:cytoskeletal protein CcmA (bactofilin family)